MAALKRPILSSALQGEITFKPGHEAYQAAKHYECWAATPALTPLIPLNTIGQVKSPLDM